MKYILNFCKVIFSVLFLISGSAYAFTECTVTVNKVWQRYEGDSTLWICFNEGGCIFKTATQVSDAQMNRMLSVAMSAMMTNYHLVVRYPEDGAVCPQINQRNDTLGFWVRK